MQRKVDYLFSDYVVKLLCDTCRDKFVMFYRKIPPLTQLSTNRN